MPVVTIATTSAQTIDNKTNWLLDEQNESISIISNGIGWNIKGSSPVKTRSNYVIVQTAADFPVPVAGVITLAAGVTYEVNGTIYMTSKINLNGCYLVGMDANNDKLIYIPGSGELFTGTKGGTIKTLTLAAITTGSKLFNLALGATENLIVRDNVIANSKEVGLVQGGYIIFFSVINYAGNLNGITFQDVTNLLLDNTAWFSTNSNTFEKMIGTFGMIEKLGGFSHSLSTMSAVSLDVSGITTINEAANFKNTAMMGTGTRVLGSFSNKWEVEVPGITTEKDDVASANLFISTTVPTTFTAVNTPSKILGTTTPVSLFRITSPVNNRLMYTGTKTRRFQVLCSLTAAHAFNTIDYSFYIYRNGVKMPESRQKIRLEKNTDQVSVTISCTAPLSTNDYLEVWVENNTGSNSISIETLNLGIK